MASDLILGIRGVRYQVKDMEAAIAFYTGQLGFRLEPYRGPALKPGQAPAFAELSLDKLGILLSGPGASGSRPLPDGREQGPGGWNRLVLRVKDLPALVAHLKGQGARFRNEIEAGPGGKQIQLEDQDGNPVELFEPAGG
jgi:glyoxylase I family protein